MKNILLISLIFILLFSNCKRDNPYNKLNNIEAKEVKAWIRYENLMQEIDTNNPSISIENLIGKYPLFGNIYFYNVINDYYKPDTSLTNIYTLYQKSPIIKDVFDTVKLVYSNLSEEEKLYSDAFARLQSLLPGTQTPDVFTCLTEFSTAAFSVSDTVMGVSLDMYLGEGYKYYDPETWPLFVQRSMNRSNIVPNLLKNYIKHSVLPAQNPKNMLDFMIAEGKEIYIMKQILPETMDTLIFDYTPGQLEFVNKSESKMWAFFSTEKLLFESDMKKIQKYIFPSPNSPGMPAEAPGRSAIYTGFKIVESFMLRNPEVKLLDLIKMNDSQKILKDARYKPE